MIQSLLWLGFVLNACCYSLNLVGQRKVILKDRVSIPLYSSTLLKELTQERLIKVPMRPSMNPKLLAVSRDITIELLSMDELHEAVELMTESHFQSTDVVTPPFIGGIVNKINEIRRLRLSDKVLKGFHARSQLRMISPYRQISDESAIIVAKDENNVIVGVVEVYPTQPVYLCNLSVLPSYRRKGIAKLLCAVCEYFVRRNWDAISICLHVERKNLPARRLYEDMQYQRTRHGFSRLGETINGHANLLEYTKDLEVKLKDKAVLLLDRKSVVSS